MTNTFEFIDIVIFVGICQGLFLSLTLQRITNTNKRANSILSWLIVISTLMLVGRVWMIRFFSKEIFYWALVLDVVIFLFGPLFFSYTRKLLIKEEASQPLSKFHFAPALVYLIVSLVYIVLYTPDTYWEAYERGELSLMFNSVLIAGIICNYYYLWCSFVVLQNFKKQEKHRFSFVQNPLKYLTVFLWAIALIIVTWSVSFINSFFFDTYISFITYDLIWAVIPVFIYVIGYFSLKQPELFRISSERETALTKERLSAVEASLLKEKLDSLMSNEKIFLKSDLTLLDVSEQLKTSTNNLSWLLNQVYKMTFYDFVNGHRVKEFVKKIENDEHLQHTILALSMDVGFNSKSTFNKAFKINMKDTPSNYIKKHRAA